MGQGAQGAGHVVPRLPIAEQPLQLLLGAGLGAVHGDEGHFPPLAGVVDGLGQDLGIAARLIPQEDGGVGQGEALSLLPQLFHLGGAAGPGLEIVDGGVTQAALLPADVGADRFDAVHLVAGEDAAHDAAVGDAHGDQVGHKAVRPDGDEHGV